MEKELREIFDQVRVPFYEEGFKHRIPFLGEFSLDNKLRREINRPLVVGGSSPSLSHIDYERLPDNPIIFRSGWSFLEEKQYLGKHIDELFP